VDLRTADVPPYIDEGLSSLAITLRRAANGILKIRARPLPS